MIHENGKCIFNNNFYPQLFYRLPQWTMDYSLWSIIENVSKTVKVLSICLLFNRK